MSGSTGAFFSPGIEEIRSYTSASVSLNSRFKGYVVIVL